MPSSASEGSMVFSDGSMVFFDGSMVLHRYGTDMAMALTSQQWADFDGSMALHRYDTDMAMVLTSQEWADLEEFVLMFDNMALPDMQPSQVEMSGPCISTLSWREDDVITGMWAIGEPTEVEVQASPPPPPPPPPPLPPAADTPPSAEKLLPPSACWNSAEFLLME